MKIVIICVGKVREPYISLGIEEFKKRLAPYISLEITEVQAFQIKTKNDGIKARQIEANKIFNIISKDDYNIALAIQGKEISSEGFAQKLTELSQIGVNKINFIIGSSTGLDESILNHANLRLSFSKMTFPHQLTRLILLEQIYRAFKIINKEPYHK